MNPELENTRIPTVLSWPSTVFCSPEKEAEWDALLSNVMQPGHLKIRPRDWRNRPAGRAATARLSGGGMMADLHMPALEVVHHLAHLVHPLHAGEREMLVHLVLKGRGELQQAGTRFRFQAGDITFRDAHQPSSVRFSGDSVHLLAIRVPVSRASSRFRARPFRTRPFRAGRTASAVKAAFRPPRATPCFPPCFSLCFPPHFSLYARPAIMH